MAPLDSFLSRFSSRLHRRDQQAVGRARQNDDENWREHVAMRPSEPPPRTHTITPGPTDTPGASILARAQQQSPLFHKLPAEIRLQIWTEVVGRQTVHILLQDRRLSHVECYAPDMEDWWRHGCILQRWDGVVPYIGRTRDGRTADGGKLGLLLACRQIYSEAVVLMYSTNTFDVDGGDRLVDLARSILPQRLAAIGGLSLRYFHSTMHDPTESIQMWRSIVDILKKMQGLRVLKLEVSSEKPAIGTNQSATRVDENTLLRPLLDIKHVQNLVVEVNWVEGEDTREWPFVLRRLTYR